MVTKTDQNSQKLMRQATLASVIVAGCLLLLKLVAWVMTDSISIQASLIDSLVDSLASAVNFIAIRQALRPADDEHRFGHGKIEAIAAQGQSIFIAGTALWLGFEALQRFAKPEPIAQTGLGIAVILITILVTLGLVRFQQYVINKTNSTVIKADHLHFKGDLFLNLSVLASLIFSSQLGWHFIDPLCGLAIGGYIMWTSWKIAQAAFNILIDRELPAEDHAKIDAIIQNNPEVRGYHDLKTRSAGPKCFIQLHLELDGTMTLNQAHRIAAQVAEEIRKTFPQTEVIIHQDPDDDR
jgi:cation diffusion facilitator family transporter